jgi:hypothetical protein
MVTRNDVNRASHLPCRADPSYLLSRLLPGELPKDLPVLAHRLVQRLDHLAQLAPLAALVGIACRSGLAVSGAWASRVLPRSPLLHHLRLARPPFRCPAGGHPDAPIVRFARVADCRHSRGSLQPVQRPRCSPVAARARCSPVGRKPRRAGS